MKLKIVGIICFLILLISNLSIISSASSGPIIEIGEIEKTRLNTLSIEIKNVGDEVAQGAFLNMSLAVLSLLIRILFKPDHNFIPGASCTLRDLQPGESIRPEFKLLWIGKLDMTIKVGIENVTMDTKKVTGFAFYFFFIMFPK